MFAALFGAVMSSLDSMLNSASTIFTVDIYGRHLARRTLKPKEAVRIGRIATAAFIVFACLLAPYLAEMGGIYEYMQRVWNFIWPGILAVFLLGLVLPRAPAVGAVITLIITPVCYGGFMIYLERSWQSQAFLNAASGAFLVGCAVMVVSTRCCPLPQPRTLPKAGVVDLEVHPDAKALGAVVIALTVALYIIFW
jgi:SSS family solute:Na+ symporter